MQALGSRVDSSASLMAGISLVRERDDHDERGLGSCGGANAADEGLLAEMKELQELKAPFRLIGFMGLGVSFQGSHGCTCDVGILHES